MHVKGCKGSPQVIQLVLLWLSHGGLYRSVNFSADGCHRAVNISLPMDASSPLAPWYLRAPDSPWLDHARLFHS
jgi:hypothetical protein